MTLPQKLDNILLASIDAQDLAQIQSDLTYVDLSTRQMLVARNAPIEHVYFVQSGIVSVVAQSHPTRAIEAGIVGREGVSGLPLILGVARSRNEEFVQVAGTALRMSTEHFVNALDRLPQFRAVLSRYVHAFMIQMAEGLLSAGADHMGPRLARWLLMCQDRIRGPVLPLTHEFLATMLSVRRSGVTESIHVLEGQNLIKASRGQVFIVDRPGLLALAGDSYGVPEEEYSQLFDPDLREATSANNENGGTSPSRPVVSLFKGGDR